MTIPYKIYLQVFDGGEPTDDVTWSEDRINDSDVEYRRVYDRKNYPEREKNKYHADEVLSVLICADKNFNDMCNSVQVAFKDKGELKDTNAPSLIFDKASRAKLRRLLYSAIDCLTDIDD